MAEIHISITIREGYDTYDVTKVKGSDLYKDTTTTDTINLAIEAARDANAAWVSLRND